ncbi:hypothetical protein LEP1GSC188_4856 [Leptospira weilii serovar Topaz str. LT2116]|uniref:Uncharacterized protein n=1 Tax=Leptospira weilii serovar Topaz str. LT2116 TaxID=1088540 RepID=M3GSY9_9LEPT|nr:hypothetical protein LEP1GSC188_4856 [Leptospira weilii serovar Topaz str. LT2116]
MGKKTNVEKLREIRDQLNAEVEDMTIDECLEFLESKKSDSLHSKKWWAEKEKSQKQQLSKV